MHYYRWLGLSYWRYFVCWWRSWASFDYRLHQFIGAVETGNYKKECFILTLDFERIIYKLILEDVFNLKFWHAFFDGVRWLNYFSHSFNVLNIWTDRRNFIKKKCKQMFYFKKYKFRNFSTRLKTMIESNSTWEGAFYQSECVKINSSWVIFIFSLYVLYY